MFNWLYAICKSAAHCAEAPSPICITPLTLPKPVTGPLLVPKFPVSWDCPVFTTAPSLVKAIKFAAVPSVGAWA